jgi:hypothetical protein
MVEGRTRATRWIRSVVGTVAVATALVIPTVQSQTAGAAAIARPEGAGPPVPASGMGTQAALDNPRCRHDDPKYGPYGHFDSTEIGGGPVCVKAWKAGADNGGATAQGVTAKKITIVVVLPNEQQRKTDPVAPKARAGSTPGTYEDAIYDWMLPQMRFYETWGRDVELKFFTSSGSDEQAQRADLVAITAEKPFAAVVLAQPATGDGNLSVLEAGIAAARIPVMGYTGTMEEANAQAPYRWISADGQAAAVNTAEVVGKQLVGKKAEFGGDDVKSQTRKFGVVHYDEAFDSAGFVKYLAKFGGKVSSDGSFPTTSTDATAIETQAATMVARMKDAGVTTVINFTGRDGLGPLMENATKQEWFPEWFFSGAAYADLGLLVRNYPVEQSVHAFGLSFIYPWTEEDAAPAGQESYATKVDPNNWYWGVDAGTFTARPTTPLSWWLLAGIHAAGPNLTPKTFQQGLFALPPRGGAGGGGTDSSLVAYGKGPKLPYNEYALSGYDFAPYWWDTKTTGPSNGLGTVGEGVGWFVDGGKRYVATTWPKKQFAWFDKTQSIYHFTTPPTSPLGYAGDCKGCPATGGPGEPGAPSNSAVVFKAGGTGAAAA